MEPLEGYESSSLSFSGNSSVRVPWYTKLGVHRDQSPRICTFKSLAPDGGFIPLVDVVILKIYPTGYKGEFVEGQSQEFWCEEEEKDKQRAWEVS